MQAPEEQKGVLGTLKPYFVMILSALVSGFPFPFVELHKVAILSIEAASKIDQLLEGTSSECQSPEGLFQADARG